MAEGMSKLPVHRNPTFQAEQVGQDHEQDPDQPEEIDAEGGPNSQVDMGKISQLSNTMMFQLESESSQYKEREVQLQPLPDSMFIPSNQPAGRPIPPHTAMKNARAAPKRKATHSSKVADPKKSKKA